MQHVTLFSRNAERLSVTQVRKNARHSHVTCFVERYMETNRKATLPHEFISEVPRDWHFSKQDNTRISTVNLSFVHIVTKEIFIKCFQKFKRVFFKRVFLNLVANFLAYIYVFYLKLIYKFIWNKWKKKKRFCCFNVNT